MRRVISGLRLTVFWWVFPDFAFLSLWSASQPPTCIYQMKALTLLNKWRKKIFFICALWTALRELQKWQKFLTAAKYGLISNRWVGKISLSVFHENFFGSSVRVCLFPKNVWLAHPQPLFLYRPLKKSKFLFWWNFRIFHTFAAPKWAL